MNNEFNVLTHSSIKINSSKIIYFDPFDINKNFNDADFIFITHSHYEHFSPNNILKVKKDDTIFIIPANMIDDLINIGISKNNIVGLNQNENIKIDDINIETIPAYNINKEFHKKSDNWQGYIITIDGKRIYVAGDTDFIDELKNIKCDIAFIPIGGTYTMDIYEGIEFVKNVKPQTVIPTHFGSVVGSSELGNKFFELLNNL